jgi:hypothetical protein
MGERACRRASDQDVGAGIKRVQLLGVPRGRTQPLDDLEHLRPFEKLFQGLCLRLLALEDLLGCGEARIASAPVGKETVRAVRRARCRRVIGERLGWANRGRLAK